ncbi:MAG: asparagine--tRNA ligase [Candidatus Kryptonium sp.]|nr:asparagine--tRNA ligase [Candidatus Kryptonium sp.]MDW8109761.1 asparagine--tRNA ligase [Candidatus Kryptonium sp.]
MAPEVYIENLSDYVGKEVKIYGWVYNKRSSGKIRFVLVRDGTGILQCVMTKGETPDEVFDKYDILTQESSLIVSGVVNEDKRAPGGYELHIKDIQIIHISQDYPITPKEHGVDFLMDHRHLWLRSRRPHAILRIRHRLVKAIRDFFDSKGFVLIDAPILTPSACEGTTTLFETDYFDLGKAYLSQSGQLYVEAAAMAFGKVYCFGPTFRAEKSKTRRHLTEFWMVEPEVAFYELDDIMNLAEEFVEYIVGRVLETSKKEFEVLERNTEPLEKIKRPFPRISYNEAVEILRKNGVDFKWGNDFGNTDETIISQQFDKPIIVHRYPAAVKAFYMKRDPNDETYALSFDMLAPEGYGEIIGGSQREDDYDTLLKRIKEHNLPVEAFDWYLDLRKYGSVPHSGFGLGVERTLAWICGLDHVRETIPFPRMIYRIKP